MPLIRAATLRGIISRLGAVPVFGNRDLSKAAASILGDEAMHWAVLRNALGEAPVPSGPLRDDGIVDAIPQLAALATRYVDDAFGAAHRAHASVEGITHFIVGSGGKLRSGDINKNSGLTAKGFDTDRTFLAVEIDKDECFFSAISRTGSVIDSGSIQRRRKPAR